jgi:hypothetical protein
MRKLVATLLVAAMVAGGGGAAVADTIPHPGVVKSVDPVSKIVELEDGMKLRPYTGVEVEGLKPGSRVIVHYYDTGEVKLLGSYEYVTN